MNAETSQRNSDRSGKMEPGKSMSFKRQILRGLGMISTLLLGAMALAPDSFRISQSWRPWLFMISIAWFFAYCAGMFDIDTDTKE